MIKNRFKLTTGFLIVSTAIFIIASVVITQSARRNEEANLIQVVSEQSSRDAQVIAGVVTGFAVSGEMSTDLASPPESASGIGNLAITTFLQSSNIVRLALYDIEGHVLWSSAGDTTSNVSNVSAFNGAINGRTVTGLTKDVEFVSLDGETGTGDITSTFLPLLDVSSQEPTQILEVAREVTGALDSRIESTRSSMFRTVFGTLGGSFIILFGLVLTADIVIGRSRTRAVTHERALADEKIVAHQLELENQQLRQLNEERDRFLSMVSHELRTPLTTIMGFTDVLRRRQEGEKKERNQQHLDLMRRNGEHLNSLIEEMLEITRIEAGKFEVIKMRFDLDQLLDQVMDSATVMLKSRNQMIKIDSDTEGVELHGDRKRVMQVLLNLLNNASKYSAKNTAITITVRYENGSVDISVGDEGLGIPETERKHLFERFYRMDNEATRSQSGLGLGLSIVKAIVDAHHGTIDVKSQVGVGTVMTVRLPGATKVDTNLPSLDVEPEPRLNEELEHLENVRRLRTMAAKAEAS